MNRTPAAEHSLVSQKKRCFHLDRVDFSSIENLLNSTYIKKTDNMMESQTDANTASRRLLCSLNTAECLTNMNSAFTPNLSSVLLDGILGKLISAYQLANNSAQFYRNGQSSDHLHHQNNPRPFACITSSKKESKCPFPSCTRIFTRKWLLKNHIRTHTKEKPFECEHPGCQKSFADKSNLRAHIKTHTKTKEYQCSICKRQFKLKSYLSKHMASNHRR